MAKFSFFSFEWLSGNERKKQKEAAELRKVELALVEKELQISEFDSKQIALQGEFKRQTAEAPTKPFKSVRLISSTCLVVLNDGTTLSKEDPTLLGKVRQAQSEEEIIELFTKYEVATDKEEEKEERALVVSNIEALKGHEDFLIQGENVYLKGVNLVIPPIVLASMIELVERIDGMYENIAEGCTSCDIEELEEQYEALKMFWRWTSLNPIENSRKDLIRFVKENDITITANGLLVCYRRVVKKGGDNHELIGFISNQYTKLKKWKKSPKNYEVYKVTNDGENYEYILGTSIGDPKVQDWNNQELLGNLEELYLDLPNMQKHSFTDNHTHRKDIRIGQVYKEDEDKINLDSNQSCGSGLKCVASL